MSDGTSDAYKFLKEKETREMAQGQLISAEGAAKADEVNRLLERMNKEKALRQGALRLDSGKPELHHIHPVAWQAYIHGYTMNPIITALNKAMDDFFYYDKNYLKTAWNENPKMEHILEMTKVLEFGAKKYASLNYAKGMKYTRVINSFRRHILKLVNGELTDDESGISHLGHIMCNYMFILTYSVEKIGEDNDDRVILKERSDV